MSIKKIFSKSKEHEEPETEKKLNIDVFESVYKFESLMERIIPKRIYYKLLLRGKGLEFDSYRNFNPDDDASSIDWKASMRANNLLVKQYVEERDIKVIFLIDVGDSMVFGSQDKLKCEYVAEMASSLCYVITNTAADQVGYFLFNNDIVREMPSRPGKKQFEAFVHQISDPECYGGVSDIDSVLKTMLDRLDPSVTLLFIISDFIKMSEKSRNKLENIGAMFETVAIIVRDPLDMTFPELNREVVIEDPASGEKVLVNPKIAKKIYEENARIQLDSVKKIFSECNVDFLELITDSDFSPPLAMFLKNRAERRD